MEKDTDKLVLESVAMMVIMSIVDKHFEEYCEAHLNKEGCDCNNCRYHYCKSETDCKAMYLTEALRMYNCVK